MISSIRGKNRELRYRIIWVMLNSGIWIQHNKTDYNIIIINEKGFSFCVSKVCIKIFVMIISVFVHFIWIILCHLILIFLIYIP